MRFIRPSNGVYLNLKHIAVVKACDPGELCPKGTLEALGSGIRVEIPAADAPTFVMLLEEKAIQCGPLPVASLP